MKLLVIFLALTCTTPVAAGVGSSVEEPHGAPSACKPEDDVYSTTYQAVAPTIDPHSAALNSLRDTLFIDNRPILTAYDQPAKDHVIVAIHDLPRALACKQQVAQWATSKSKFARKLYADPKVGEVLVPFVQRVMHVIEVSEVGVKK